MRITNEMPNSHASSPSGIVARAMMCLPKSKSVDDGADYKDRNGGAVMVVTRLSANANLACSD